MQQRKKSNTVSTYAIVGDVITFTVEGVGSFDFNTAKAGHQTDARDHGYVQKIKDCAAIGRDPETGLSATPEEKFDAMKACAERLQNGGPWNAMAVGGTGNAGGLLYRAMQTLYPGTWADRAAFSAFIKSKAEELKVTESAIRAGYAEVKTIAREMEKIRKAEATPSGIDSATLLEGLPT